MSLLYIFFFNLLCHIFLGRYLTIIPFLICRLVTNKKIPEQCWISGIFGNWNTKFQFREFPFHFGDWDRTGSGHSPEWAGIRRDRKWLALNARDRKCYAFSGQKIWYPKTEIENSDFYNRKSMQLSFLFFIFSFWNILLSGTNLKLKKSLFDKELN